jgi:predicted PurR-regulated permease PerM
MGVALATAETPLVPLSAPPVPTRSFALNSLLFLAVMVLLKLAKPLMVTLALSLFFYFLLMPLVLFLGKCRVPRALAAGVVVTVVLGVLSYGVLYAVEPAAEWMEEIPELIPSMREKLLPVSEPMAKIEQAASEVENITKPDGPEQPQVSIAEDSVVQVMLTETTMLLASTGVIVFLTFFFLTFGERLQEKIARLGRSFAEQRRLVRIARSIQSQISRFLGVISAINLCLAAIASFVFWFLEVPNYLLWGVLGGIANFVPYAGAAAMTVLLAAVGLLTFDSLGDAALVPGSFLVLTILEGQLITPMLIGRQLNLSPVIVFFAVIFWAYMWGLAGALVAVPILVSTKIVFSHVPAFQPLATLFRR